MNDGDRNALILIGLMISIPLFYFLRNNITKSFSILFKKIGFLGLVLVCTLIAFLIFDGFYLFHKIELLWKWETIIIGIINGVLLLLLAMAGRIVFNVGFAHFLFFLEKIYKYFTKYKR